MEKEKRKHIGIVGIMGILILGIIIFIVLKLVIWNKSGDNIVMEDVPEGTYDSESLDIVFNVDPSLTEGKDDGVNTILCIHDGILDYKTIGGTMSLCDYLREIPNSEIISIPLYASQVADAINAYAGPVENYWQAGNLYDVVYALCNNDLSLQKMSVDNGGHVAETQYEALCSVDMDKVDTIFIMYDSADYSNASVLYNPEDDYDTTTYEGALRASLSLLQKTHPEIRVVFGSSFFHGVIQDDHVVSAAMVNYGNGTLSEYVKRAYNIVMERGLSYLDNYYNLINEENLGDYCSVDTLTDEGIKLLGEHMKDYFQRRY